MGLCGVVCFFCLVAGFSSLVRIFVGFGSFFVCGWFCYLVLFFFVLCDWLVSVVVFVLVVLVLFSF